MKVLKFGGSSVATAQNIKKVIQIIFDSSKKTTLVVVVSAFGGITDKLIKSAQLAAKGDIKYKSSMQEIIKQHNQTIKKLIKPTKQKKVLAEIEKKYGQLERALKGIFLLNELSPRALDKIMSFGEQLSAYIISQAIKEKINQTNFVDARQLIKTDSNFNAAQVNIRKSYAFISKYFKQHHGVFIMGGFIAADKNGVTTTLGRGGSDYSAALLGAALNSQAIEIWTDVDGIMTADPRQIKQAFVLSDISYEEATELAHFGAKVIYPKTILPAQLKNIPIYIKNTFNPRLPGTKISNQKPKRNLPVKGVSLLANICLLRILFHCGLSFLG